eukprot:TRINITY_DN20066_c0_g1_i1.p1 TRINITY_DN20066_c0_g1~~TRINITY_DN20066_c0_g1_i1.p1  ORF type:complete len:124 (+),score=27.39 TRINITY_DN20066_c0_g1_i1:159-530(+)
MCIRDRYQRRVHGEAIESGEVHIKTMLFENIVKGLTCIFSEMAALQDIFRPCLKSFLILEKLFGTISHSNIWKISVNIFQHSSQFLSSITEAVDGFQNNDGKAAGLGFGTFLKCVFFLSLIHI